MMSKEERAAFRKRLARFCPKDEIDDLLDDQLPYEDETAQDTLARMGETDRDFIIEVQGYYLNPETGEEEYS